ncbi:MAG TPA: hypothetical protein VLZ33_00295 [Dysgonamonadaceae bacterium]|nr:hypothetical protein [Dysgonamonadaceae bacterium]
MKQSIFTLTISLCFFFTSCVQNENQPDLSKAVFVVSPSVSAPMKSTLLQVLTEEIEKRASLEINQQENWDNKTVIALALSTDKELFGKTVPVRDGSDLPEMKKEGFRLLYSNENGEKTLWIIGADSRGLLFGIGKFLRIAEINNGEILLPGETDIATSPEYAIRGHQFGYRNTANSWDAWSIEQFDQHFREQMLFGANCFENIPFQEPKLSVHMTIPRKEMNIAMSQICKKYDADYWIWTPAVIDLKDKELRQAEIEEHEAFYKSCPRLDGVFFPGGDPGKNHPSDVLPFLEELTRLLHKYHPNAGMWISLQGFNKEGVDYFFNYINKESPDWLTGVANGPSSPPLKIERKRLPKKYKLRSYPDLTHTVRCQFPTKNWDQAFALTEGRECTNPQPRYYAEIHNNNAPLTDGFLSYSDGVHDDVNKVVWSQMGWDTTNDIEDVMLEYCNLFFGAKVASDATKGVFALEENWIGPITGNPVIQNTLNLWKKLETENPQLADNWRWQQLVMRAYYDAFVQQRQAYEKGLENEAYAILSTAKTIGAEKAMKGALEILKKAETEPVAQDLKQKIVQYCDDLFHSIGLQTSVPKYNAKNYERGAILDFIDYPLNNRWWLEDEFKKIDKIKSEEEKIARLDFIRTYENPGEGSFYDNISSADAKHVISETDDAIDYLWEDDGFSRKRLSTQLFQFQPELVYNELDPNSDYLIRVAGFGEALLRANGERLKPTKYEKGYEQFKEFPLPKELIKDGKLKITFNKPDEEHLNWRQQSRVTDVWVIK